MKEYNRVNNPCVDIHLTNLALATYPKKIGNYALDRWFQFGSIAIASYLSRLTLPSEVRSMKLLNQKLHLSRQQACKLKFKLRKLISCFCCICTNHTALKADGWGYSETSGSEVSKPKFEFTGSQACLAVIMIADRDRTLYFSKSITQRIKTLFSLKALRRKHGAATE